MLRFPSPSLAVSFTALVIALGGVGYSATGGNFILGKNNNATTLTRLVAPLPAAAFRVDNLSSGPNSTGVSIYTEASHPPMFVSSSAKVANLNVDFLDGLNSTAFASATSEGWHYVGDTGQAAFENGWGNFNGAGLPHNQVTNQHAAYRVDSLGVIHLGGVVAGGTIGQPIFTLPASHCPFFTKIFPAISNNEFSRVTVNNQTTGCAVFANFGSNVSVSLEGVDFQTAELEQKIAD